MTRYLIIGDGRASRHIQHYFKELRLSFSVWSRHAQTTQDNARKSHAAQTLTLQEQAQNADRALLLLRDDQLENFLITHPYLRNFNTIHFSGAKQIDGISSAHPLMTFSGDFYPLEVYKNMAFITDANGPKFSELFPELKNPNFRLTADKKALYHALCVLMGNFTTVLWENAAQTFTKELQLPKTVLLPYLNQVAINSLQAIESGESALTGPVARGDIKTIIRNIDALENQPERDLYYAFINYLHARGKKIGDLPNDYLAI